VGLGEVGLGEVGLGDDAVSLSRRHAPTRSFCDAARMPRPGHSTVAVASRVAPRVAALAAVLVTLAAVHIRRPATLCPVRALTGLPCPLCGGTTAAVRLGHADVRGAVVASPLAVGLLCALPIVRLISAPRWWRSKVVRVSLIAATLAAAETWELLRLSGWHL
jgi:hypothetical protein